MNEKIINKIRKMFALANNEGAAPGEAENAMRMANNLMEKHMLTSMDLHTGDRITIDFIDSQRYVWVRALYNAVCPVYSCSMFLSGKEYVLVGTESNMVTVGIIVDGLIKNIKRASKGKGIAFANGAVLEISKQCRNLIADRKSSEEIAPGSGLVLANIYQTQMNLVQEFMDKKFNLTSGRRSNMNSSNAGREYGATLNPHTNLSNRKALN